jgi:DNA-binding transcriptional LysR family regulator
MNLDLGSLRSVVAAAEHGSFRQAAAALNLKQSALSRRVRHLEDQVGVSLFERSSGGVRLTPAGASMAQAARRLFEEIDDMIKASQLADRGELWLANIATQRLDSIGALEGYSVNKRRFSTLLP